MEIIPKAQNAHVNPDYWGIQKSSTNSEIEHKESVLSFLCNWAAETIGASVTLYSFTL